MQRPHLFLQFVAGSIVIGLDHLGGHVTNQVIPKLLEIKRLITVAYHFLARIGALPFIFNSFI